MHTIGQVRAQITNVVPDDMFDNVGHYAAGNTTSIIEYMCYETGVGTGRVWKEESLWETEEAAQDECDRLNQLEGSE